MDIIDSEQFEKTHQLRQLARQIKIARIVMLLYVCFVLQHQAMRVYTILDAGNGISYKGMNAEYIFLAILTVVLSMTIGSFYRPLILMPLISVIAFVYFIVDITAIMDVIMYFDKLDATFLNINVAIWLSRLVVTILMIKGTIAVRKYEQLKKHMTD